MIEADLLEAGIDLVPRNLAAILAKLNTGDIRDGKGLFLCGSTGTGKTVRMRWAAEAFDIRFITARKLCAFLMDAKSEGERDEALNAIPPRWSDYPMHYGDLIVDDLGAEPDGQVIYGTQVSVMVDAILRRYELFPRWKTHFTSNLTEQQIRERYGERVWSRLNEMVVFVTLAGKDWRMGK